MTEQRERLKKLELKGLLRSALKNLSDAGRHMELDNNLKDEPVNEWVEINLRKAHEGLWLLSVAVQDLYKAVTLLAEDEEAPERQQQTDHTSTGTQDRGQEL